MYQITQHPYLEQAVTETEYRNLVDTVADATIFNDWAWLSTCSKHSRATEQLFITCRDQNNTLVAFLALAIVSEILYHLPVRTARFLQYPLGDRIGLLLHPDHLNVWEELLLFIGKQTSGICDVMIWNELACSCGLIERMQKWAHANHRPILLQNYSHCPVVVTQGKTKEQVSNALTSNRRSTIKRHRKKIGKLNHQIIHKIVTEDEAETLLEEISLVEGASWKGTTNQGIFSTPENWPLVRDVSLQLARLKQLFVSLIYIDGQLASYRFGFLYRNTFLDYNLAYLPEYKSHALGVILLDDLLTEAVNRNFAAIDGSRVGPNTTNLLTKWATHYINHYQSYWFGASIRGRLLQFLITTAKPLSRKTISRFKKSS